MATKTADKKKAPAAEAAPKVEIAPLDEVGRLADAYLVRSVHQAIVAHGEPAKLADIIRGSENDAIPLALVRHTCATHPQRFLAIDRRWDVVTRYIDKQRPALRILEEIVATYDAPISLRDAAHEVGLVTGRSVEGMTPVVDRLLRQSGRFLQLTVSGQPHFVPVNWALDLSDDYLTDADVLFYNFLAEDAAAPYASLKLDWSDPVAATAALLDAQSGQLKLVDSRLVLYLAHKALDEDFDSASIYNALFAAERIVLLPGHRLSNPATVERLRAYYTEHAQTLAEIVEEEEPATLEEIKPLNVNAEDLAEVDSILRDAGDRGVRVSTILEEVYETGVGDRNYQNDYQTVFDNLRARPDRYLWTGYDRFRVPGSLPPIIGQVPESLIFPVVPQIETPEGDLLDQMLDDEGFEKGLDREILSALAQDVNDQEPTERTLWPDGVSADSHSIRCVLKAHHKEIGTFPLCQIPAGFFALEPDVVELSLRDVNGGAYQVFADYETQMLYGLGLFDLYAEIAADSGAVFTLEKTSVPGEFLFTNTNETDPDIYVSRERLDQLQNYRAEIESGPTVSSHDIVRYVLEHSNAAMSYLNLLTEVNVVRRMQRRQLASILSAWSGFTHRGGLWTYDSKKGTQGFNKAKRKHML